MGEGKVGGDRKELKEVIFMGLGWWGGGVGGNGERKRVKERKSGEKSGGRERARVGKVEGKRARGKRQQAREITLLNSIFL